MALPAIMTALSSSGGIIKKIPAKVWIGLGTLAGAWFIYSRIKGGIAHGKHIDAISQIDKKTPRGNLIRIANRFYTAMDGFGTDENEIMKIAKEMHDSKIQFSDVSKEYKNLYAKDLMKIIDSELDSKEKKYFLAFLTGKLTSTVWWWRKKI